MTYKCEFCESSFDTNSLLQRHIKTAKYCLELRFGKQEKKDKKQTKKFECYGCLKEFTNKKNMNTHIEICEEVRVKKIKEEHQREIKKIKENHQKEIEKLELKIQNLQEKLEMYKSDHECIQEIAKQPKTINNNNNKYLNITPFIIKQREVERKINLNFTEDMFLDGQRGVADFTYNNLLLDDNGNSKYLCRDKNRGNFAYKNENGDIEIDYNADKLINIIHNDVIAKSESIKTDGLKKSEEIEDKSKYIDKMIEIKELKTNNNKFINRLGVLTNRKTSISVIDDDIEKTLIPITQQYMLEQSKFLTEDHIKEGIDGYIKFAHEYVFKNRVYCSDKNKNVLTYKIEEKHGEQIEIKFIDDIGGIKICSDFFKAIENVNKQITDKIYNRIEKQLLEFDSNMTDKEYEKYKILEDISYEVKYQCNSIRFITFGKENEFLHKFIDTFCISNN